MTWNLYSFLFSSNFELNESIKLRKINKNKRCAAHLRIFLSEIMIIVYLKAYMEYLVALCMCVKQKTVNFAQRMKKTKKLRPNRLLLLGDWILCVGFYFSCFSHLWSSVFSLNSQSILLSILPNGFKSCLQQQFVSFILFLDLLVVHCILYGFLWMLLNGKCTTRACLQFWFDAGIK